MRQRPNVLLIGDDDARMARLRAILRRTSYVEQAEDLPEALQQAQPDLVFQKRHAALDGARHPVELARGLVITPVIGHGAQILELVELHSHPVLFWQMIRFCKNA